MTTTELDLTPLVSALSDLWAAVRARHPELPRAAIVVGCGSDPRHPGRLVRGRFSSARWVVGHPNPTPLAQRLAAVATELGEDMGPVHEVFIAGERLRDGSEGVAATLLHEAAHALALARGVADTSRDGRYHNRRFQAIAAELGLDARPLDAIGYSDTHWTARAEEWYGAPRAAVARAIVAWRRWEAAPTVEPVPPTTPGGTPGTEGTGQGRAGARRTRSGARASRVRAVCGCGRAIQVAPGVLAQGEIRCALCGRPFVA